MWKKDREVTWSLRVERPTWQYDKRDLFSVILMIVPPPPYFLVYSVFVDDIDTYV